MTSADLPVVVIAGVLAVHAVVGLGWVGHRAFKAWRR